MKKSISSILLTLIAGVFFAFCFASMAQSALLNVGVEVSRWPITLGIVGIMSLQENVGFALFSGLDFDDVQTSLKTYISEKKADFITDLAIEAKPSYFNELTGVNGDVPLTFLKSNSVLQPGGKDAFNPTADVVKFVPRIGKVRHAKIDVLLEHTEIMALHLSWYSKVKRLKIDPSVIPFEAELMTAIINQGKFDVRDASFNGVYNAAGTTAADTVSGLKKIVTDGIAGSGIAQLPTANIWGTGDGAAAITESNAFDQLKGIARKVLSNKRYSTYPMKAIVSPTVYDFYCADYAATRGAAPYNNEFGQTLIEGTNIALQPEPMMTGSNRVIVTPTEENVYYLVDEENALTNIEVQKFNRDFKILIDFFFGIEVARIDLIWTNNYVGIS